MAVPTEPIKFSVESQEGEQVLLAWKDSVGETEYHIYKAFAVGFRFVDHMPTQDDPVFRRTKGLPLNTLYRPSLNLGDGVVLLKKDAVAANVESAEYIDLTAGEHCYRTRAVNSEGEAVTPVKCANIPSCSDVPALTGADLIALPRNSLGDLAAAVEPFINHKLSLSEPCNTCVVSNSITLDLSVCNNFNVLVDDDITTIRMVNSLPGKEGCINFILFPCADETSRKICGWPKGFGFEGGECRDAVTTGCTLQVCYSHNGDAPQIDGPPVVNPILPPSPTPHGNPSPIRPMQLKLTCQNTDCEFDCTASVKKMKLYAAGGRPPYTWSSTYGTVTPDSGTRIGILKPPIPSGTTPTGPAYMYAMWLAHWDFVGGTIPPFGPAMGSPLYPGPGGMGINTQIMTADPVNCILPPDAQAPATFIVFGAVYDCGDNFLQCTYDYLLPSTFLLDPSGNPIARPTTGMYAPETCGSVYIKNGPHSATTSDYATFPGGVCGASTGITDFLRGRLMWCSGVMRFNDGELTGGDFSAATLPDRQRNFPSQGIGAKPYAMFGTPNAKTGKLISGPIRLTPNFFDPVGGPFNHNDIVYPKIDDHAACKPCGKLAGAVVTVTDKDGKSVSKTITVKLTEPDCF